MTPRSIDFSKQPRLPWQGWALLLLGCTALAITWGLKHHWDEQAQTLQRQQALADREAAHQLATDRARTAVPPAEARRLAQLAQQLAWPWPQVLQAVDAAVAEPVYLLGMGLQPQADSNTGLLKLEAQAPTWNDALAFVEKLQRTQALMPQVLGIPQLSSQQQALDAGTNAPVVRFVVTMPLGGRLPDSRQPP